MIKLSTEFPRSFHITDLPKEGTTITIQASPVECAAIAKRAGIPDVQSFQASLDLKYLPHSDILHIHGVIDAEYRQVCALSLEAFGQKSRFEFESECMEESQLLVRAAPMVEDGDDMDDDYEPIIDGHIDLGELVVQHFIVALDPYPKKPGVEADGEWKQRASVGNTGNPFSVLKSLKNK